MSCGHSPREIEDYPWRDVEEFLAALPEINANRNLTTFND